jgi:micrococcal nuclease
MKKVLYFLVLFPPIMWASEKHYGDAVVSEVSTIYDGDTFFANIKDYPPIAGDHIAIRVKGVDTPEMKGDCEREVELARKAKQFTVTFLRSAKTIQLKNLARDKYFRIDADVYSNGKSLAAELIKAGLGYEYYGGKKRSWCR